MFSPAPEKPQEPDRYLENPKILPHPRTFGDQESEKHLLAGTVESTSQEVTGQGEEQVCVCGAIQKLQA